MPPVFLNIDGIDSNLISYCVEIVDQTSSETLLDQCGIAVTEFTYPTPADDVCHALRVTVTPVNAVGNGERQQLVHYSPSSRKSCTYGPCSKTLLYWPMKSQAFVVRRVSSYISPLRFSGVGGGGGGGALPPFKTYPTFANERCEVSVEVVDPPLNTACVQLK